VFDGEVYEELVPRWRNITVFEGESVTKGEVVVDGRVDPHSILRLKGVVDLSRYIIDEVQEVYRLQGVKINDKHIEVIVRQMMQKVVIENPGHTHFLSGDRVNKNTLRRVNMDISMKSIVKDQGDSDYSVGDLVSNQNINEFNRELKEEGKKTIKKTKAKPATFTPLLLGITRASFNPVSGSVLADIAASVKTRVVS
jgi:DNA-directed RNA polymerase subunit beta'